MNNSEAFAYSFDEELVRSVLPDWPADISVLLCLKADGSCRTVIYHNEEGTRALRRAAAVLDLPTRSFAVAPEVKGWPTRAVRFSEEQDMLTIVSGVSGLVDKAKAYAENYKTEQEQASRKEAEGAEPVRAGPTRRLNLGLAKADIAEKVRRLTAETPQPPAPPAARMPFGFMPGGPQRECQFGAGHIGIAGSFVRVILAPERVTVNTDPVVVNEIGFSADFLRFYLPRAALAGWLPGRAAVLDIPLGSFPEALLRAFEGRLLHVEATITSEGVFLAPGGPVTEPRVEVEAEEEPQLTPQPSARPRRRWLTPLRAAAAACVVAGTAAAAVNMVPLGPVSAFERILASNSE